MKCPIHNIILIKKEKIGTLQIFECEKCLKKYDWVYVLSAYVLPKRKG